MKNKKPVLNITFREVKHGEFKGEIDCLFLDQDTFNKRSFRMSCYSRIGQHSEGDITYFYNNTRPAKNYDSLLKEIESIYSDYKIVIHNKLPSYESVIKQFREAV